jgi:hypothetical protein
MVKSGRQFRSSSLETAEIVIVGNLEIGLEQKSDFG